MAKPPEEALHEQREWLRVTLSSIGDAVITTDTKGSITFLNPVAQYLTGWSLEDALGPRLESVFKIVNEETGRTVENPAIRALRDGVVVGLANHTLLVAKDGTERPIDDSAAPIRNPKGEVAGVVLVFRDVTERRRNEKALQASEERFRALTESANDAIISADESGRIVSWNKAATTIFGYTEKEVFGQPLTLLMPERFRESHRNGLARLQSTGKAQLIGKTIELEGRRRDGSEFPIELSLAAWKTEQGQFYSGIIRNISERKLKEKALRQSEERFRLLVEGVKDYAIFTLDPLGIVTSWNAGAEHIKSYRAEEIIGKHFSCFYPPDAVATGFPENELKTAATEGRCENEGWRLRKDGSQFWATVVITALRDEAGNLKGFSKITRDLTERRKLERAKVQSEVLADLNRRKDEFLAMLSHELRNPLAPILTAAHLLRLQTDDPIQQQAIAILERQVTHLTRLVDDLLEVSRISTGRIRLQQDQIDMRRIAERAVEVVRSLIVQRDHELSVSLAGEPIWLHADPTRMEQVVVNLLTNAAKYTNVGGHIRLTVQQEGNEAVLRVVDDGVGVAPDLLPSVFELFTQAERSLDRSQGGLGVGLTIVQRIVEMHGGKVEAFSAGLGHGSEFVVRLPVTLPPTTESHLAPAQSMETIPRTMRVLVVDDNKDSADIIAMLLRRAGHDVRVAYSGQTAIEAALVYHPNAVLLDIGLPEINGYEVARRLRQNPDLKDVRLVAVTGYGRDTDQQRSHEAGFDAHVVKPVDPQEIQEILANLTKQSHQG